MLRKLAALDGRRRALAASALTWVLAARTVLGSSGGRSLPAQERLLGWLATRLPALPPCTVDEAAWAITAVGRRVPGTRCLAWSLALRALLAQARIPAELRIGVVAAREPGGIEAHAWVASGGRDWSWGGDVARYHQLRPRAAAR
jgi:hypothetical protein